MTPELSIEISNRHQVYLERIKTGEFNKYAPFLKKIAKKIRSELAGNDITEFKRARLEKLIKGINQDIKIIQGQYVEQLVKSSLELAEYEVGFEARSLNQVVKHDFVIPSETQLKSAVLTNPLTANGAEGFLLEPFAREISDIGIDKITNSIRSGAYEGLTTQKIISNIIGTKARRFSDGRLDDLRKATEKIVRTGLQHVSSQARQATWNRNKDIVNGVQWVSTLDGRTSDICRSLDGQIFPTDKGPRPPAHIGCRSTTVAVLSDKFKILDKGATRSSRDESGDVKKVDADLTYYDWLKKQPRSFQESVIGKTRTNLLRNGGLTSQRFAELQLGKNFEPLTLKEMKELEPLAFEKIGA